MSSPIQVAIAGLGRSGWDIHARTLGKLPEQFQIAAVMELNAERRAEAAEKFGCRAYDDYSAMARDADVEVIVVATPNFLHERHVIEALENGKHVVCEKPFGATSAEADAMIEAARRAGKLVAPFQNRRYEPHYQKVKSVLESGLLGEIQVIHINWHGFKRRWDWQTLAEFGGGDLSNTGPHALDHALGLFGETEPEVFVDLRNVLSSGDAEDHCVITLKAPGAPTIHIEVSSCCAYPQDRWLVMGSAGGLRGTTQHLEWKWVDWSQLEPHTVDRVPTPDRSYNRETLNWNVDECQTNEGGGGEVSTLFYRDFAQSVREGKPLFISPESVRRNIALIEKCKSLTSIAQGQFALQNAK